MSGRELHLAAMMALAGAGYSVISVGRDEFDSFARRGLDDRLDTLAFVLGDAPMSDPAPVRIRRSVTHIDTPKPISKRKARRLRGAARALASSEQSS